MAPFSLKPSSKGVTALIIVAALVLFSTALLFVAAFGKIRSQDDKCAEMEKRVADSRLMAQKLEKTRLTYLDTCSQIRFLESSVSTQSYVPTLLQQLEHLGKSVNLKVLGVRPQVKQATAAGPRSASSGAKAADGNLDAASAVAAAEAKKKAEPYDELCIDVDVEGSFNNALDFIYKLTSFPKIIAVNSVQITPVTADKSIGSPRLSVKLNITAYVMKETSPNSAPKAPTDNLTGKNTSGEGRSGNEAG